MRLPVILLTATAVLISNPFPVRAADDAAAIIDKAIKAQGGAEKLGKFKAEQWSAKGIVEVMGQKFEYTALYWYEDPERVRFEMETSFGGQKFTITAATDGKKCWEKVNDKLQDQGERKAKAFQHNAYAMHLCRLLPLKEKGLSLSVTGEEKIGGKPAVGILVSAKGHRDVTLFFDKESSLLVKVMTDAWDEFADKDVPQEIIFADYKEKDGHKVFGKLTIKRDGKLFLEEELSGQKFLDKLDPKLFEKP
jgi:hypothetical protein